MSGIRFFETRCIFQIKYSLRKQFYQTALGHCSKTEITQMLIAV